MPRRASMSSTPTTARRTSGRLPPPAPISKVSTPAIKRVKSTPATSIATTQLAEEREEEDAATDTPNGKGNGTTSTKRKAASSVAGSTASRARMPKQRKVTQGINAIAKLFPEGSSDSEARSLFYWGDGGSNQLGAGVDATDEVKRPELHQWVEDKIQEGRDGWERGFSTIECGGMHSVGVDAEGNVWTWGANDAASLGRITNNIEGSDSDELESVPMIVQSLRDEGFRTVRVSAGDSHTVAISDDGQLRAWGSFRNSEGPLGFNNSSSSKMQFKPVSLPNVDSQTVVQVASGDDHFLALTSEGRVYVCGNGEQHQLGRKVVQRHKTHGLTPERLALKDIVLVGCGSYHSFAVNAKGNVYAFGSNAFHQTGVSEDGGGDADTIETPTIVESLDPSLHGGAHVVQIAGGTHHTIFLLSNGDVFACGRCDGHDVGLADSHPAMIAKQERKDAALAIRALRRTSEAAILVTGGMDEAAAAHKAEELAAQLVELPNEYVDLPTKLTFPAGGENIVHIASGTKQNFAVSEEGKIFGWGFGNVSQLGLGAREEAETPMELKSKPSAGVNGVEAFRAVHVSTGGQHSLALAIRKTPLVKKVVEKMAEKPEVVEEPAAVEEPAVEEETKEVEEPKAVEEAQSEVPKEAEDPMDVDPTPVEEPEGSTL